MWVRSMAAAAVRAERGGDELLCVGVEGRLAVRFQLARQVVGDEHVHHRLAGELGQPHPEVGRVLVLVRGDDRVGRHVAEDVGAEGDADLVDDPERQIVERLLCRRPGSAGLKVMSPAASKVTGAVTITACAVSGPWSVTTVT